MRVYQEYYHQETTHLRNSKVTEVQRCCFKLDQDFVLAHFGNSRLGIPHTLELFVRSVNGPLLHGISHFECRRGQKRRLIDGLSVRVGRRKGCLYRSHDEQIKLELGKRGVCL